VGRSPKIYFLVDEERRIFACLALSEIEKNLDQGTPYVGIYPSVKHITLLTDMGVIKQVRRRKEMDIPRNKRAYRVNEELFRRMMRVVKRAFELQKEKY